MELILRTATAADLDDLANIACAAFPADPQWDYRFPRRKEFPDDTYRCTREGYKSMLEEDGVAINVITTDVHGAQQPIALAVWELMFEETSNFLDIANCDDRRDADFKRMKAFDDACFKAKKTFFDDVYGDQQIHLRILATHPDWQRHGAGTKHCNWGLDLAYDHRIPVTVLSSPLGGQLYTYLKFETLGFFKVQVEGEEEKLSIGAMVKHYKDDDGELEKRF
ncbi:hypothetical protein N0V83_007558 [Neocucurbitaria cava]|uniref:N-acetyltransferase domain-containing protein n=1 Tax=Neocucurbitaria cava TaxID=798079 RepID=A0A9W9CKI5_9PLEO|nr:hypothetical protein N0V83_007558 [Neocucurbitaria cava]